MRWNLWHKTVKIHKSEDQQNEAERSLVNIYFLFSHKSAKTRGIHHIPCCLESIIIMAFVFTNTFLKVGFQRVQEPSAPM